MGAASLALRITILEALWFLLEHVMPISYPPHIVPVLEPGLQAYHIVFAMILKVTMTFPGLLNTSLPTYFIYEY